MRRQRRGGVLESRRLGDIYTRRQVLVIKRIIPSKLVGLSISYLSKA